MSKGTSLSSDMLPGHYNQTNQEWRQAHSQVVPVEMLSDTLPFDGWSIWTNHPGVVRGYYDVSDVL